MLKETADELGLTPYVLNNTFDDPLTHALSPSFYAKMEHPDDPPIYLEVLDRFVDLNNQNEESNKESNEESNKENQ